jgi:2-haloacid dehalogenase
MTAPLVSPVRVRALVFDIFGTVVDWHGSVRREVAGEAAKRGLVLDAARFASDWRAGYAPAMQAVRTGALPWTTIDGLHRRILDGLLERYSWPSLTESERQHLNRIWHRLDPWPDSAPGLAELRRQRVCATLSNGNMSLLIDLARHGGLGFDAILSAELFGHYKPDPEVYLGACRLLDLPPEAVMMVAAHPSDLRAAAACGLRTAYIPRPDEQGPGGSMEAASDGEFDVVAPSLVALAARLGPVG